MVLKPRELKWNLWNQAVIQIGRHSDWQARIKRYQRNPCCGIKVSTYLQVSLKNRTYLLSLQNTMVDQHAWNKYSVKNVKYLQNNSHFFNSKHWLLVGKNSVAVARVGYRSCMVLSWLSFNLFTCCRILFRVKLFTLQWHRGFTEISRYVENITGYFKNHWTKHRHVCTHFDAFSMLMLNMGTSINNSEIFEKKNLKNSS